MKNIFLINGSGSCGKDSFCNFCADVAPTMNISSVDKVKEAAEILGWSGGKSERDRKFLSDIKSLSDDYNDGRYLYIKEKIERF
jgi:hypothetical protein